MPANYTTIKNDTPRAIAIKFYGDGSQYALILQANPDIQASNSPILETTELAAGQDLIIPDNVEPTPADNEDQVKITSQFDKSAPVVGAEDPDEILIVINGQAFRFFNNSIINFSYDKLANEFSFVAPFDPDIPEIKAAFRTFFQPTNIYIGGDLILTGQSWANPSLEPGSNTVNVKGYIRTGNLSKSTIFEPYEFSEGSTLSEIITDIAKRFGLPVVIDSQARTEADKPYEARVTFSNTEAVGGKLTSLTKERGLVLSSTSKGSVLITKPAIEGETVQSFVSGEFSTTIDIKPEFNADALFTSYIAYAPENSIGSDIAEKATATGLKQPGIIQRIRAIVAPEAANINIQSAVDGDRGRSFGAWLKVSVTAVGWRDRNGNLYKPNTFVTARAPRSMLYEDVQLFVRSVTLNKSNNVKSANLELILPESLSGKPLSFSV